MTGAQGLLAEARANIRRLSPREVHRSGRLLIDVRTEAHRRLSGDIPGALVIDLTVLPWRLDPTFGWRIPEATGWDVPYAIICRHGYSSSVAAYQLTRMGLTDVVDVVGGFDAWAAAGLPVAAPGLGYVADVRE